MSIYSMSTRRRVIALSKSGLSNRQISIKLSLHMQTVAAYLARHAEGNLSPTKSGPKFHTKLTDVHLQQMRELVAAHPSITLIEINKQLDIDVQPSTISRALKKMGITRKKRPQGLSSNNDRKSSKDAKTS